MRIAAVSPGGVGGYFGGLLARAGEDVVALARGEHLSAIRQNGLRLEGPRGSFDVRLQVSDDAAELGCADVVLFAVKLFQIEAAVNAAAKLFGAGSIGISLMNGVEGAERVARCLPSATILDGCAYVSAVIGAPGHIQYTGDLSSIVFARPAPETQVAAVAVEFTKRCERAGFVAHMSDDIKGELWKKLIGLSTTSAMTTASRRPCGDLFHDPDILEVTTSLLSEAISVANAKGILLSPLVQDEWLGLLKSLPPGLYASMYYDLVRGHQLEVDDLSGYIVREGKRLGISTPHHAALYAVLKPHRFGD